MRRRSHGSMRAMLSFRQGSHARGRRRHAASKRAPRGLRRWTSRRLTGCCSSSGCWPTPWGEPREGDIDVGGEHELLLRRQRRGIGQHVGEHRRRPVVPHRRCVERGDSMCRERTCAPCRPRLIASSISRGSHRQEPRAGRHRRASALGSPNSHAHVAGGSARQRRCALVRLHEPEPLVDSARHLRQDVGAVGVVQLRHGGDSASRRPGEAG